MTHKKAKKTKKTAEVADPSVLTLKQQKFVYEYLLSGNATEAALKAGYSENVAAQQGSENLRKPYIRELIQAAYERRKQQYEVSENKIVGELAKIAFFDIGNVMRRDHTGVSLLPWDEMPEASRQAIQTVNESMEGSMSVKAHDKLSALKMLGQHIGMWKDAKQPGADTKPIDVINKRLLGAIQKRKEQGRP